jgi:hypothetical protein
MKLVLYFWMVFALLATGPALAISVEAQVEGPLLSKERVVGFVSRNLGRSLAAVPDVENGGKHRLFVRVASKYVTPGNYLYLTDVRLQRRVIDIDTQRVYWATIQSAVQWGTVPTENEVRGALDNLLRDKADNFQLD